MNTDNLRAEDREQSQLAMDRIQLAKVGVSPDQQGAIDYLNRLRPTDESKRSIAHLIVKLGHSDFVTREKARKSLHDFGIQAEVQLRVALDSRDLEVAMQANNLLQTLTELQDSGLHDARLSAALRFLLRERHPDSVRTLLKIIPLLQRQNQMDQACAALWFAVESHDADRIAQCLFHEHQFVRMAAIPALEIVHGDPAVVKIRPFLSDPSESIRLAAVRALIDREPRLCAAKLVELLGSDDTRTKLRAAWLLSQLFDPQTDEKTDLQFEERAKIWKSRVATLETSQWQLPLRGKRLQLHEFRGIYREEFKQSVAKIIGRYGQLQYETSVANASASVDRGLLRLHGNHAEGDQRMIVTAKQLIGSAHFTKSFDVKAEIGGEAEGSGGYHVGISIGNLRLLFHPGHRGGGFRIERVDNHQYIVTNQSMPFTPLAGVLHKMRVRVTPQKEGRVLLEAIIANPKAPQQTYVNKFLAEKTDIGPLTQVRIERSGRSGGDALFGSFSVDTVGIDQRF
ncbi:MAG: hypothetical protein P8L85_20045 [Rubripirellula sp.]|nr:hypothetical protein [Rubripirellula sp.]